MRMGRSDCCDRSDCSQLYNRAGAATDQGTYFSLVKLSLECFAFASNDASLLYRKLFSFYVHIPRRCSSSSLIALCLTRVLVSSILPSKTVHRRDSLLNT